MFSLFVTEISNDRAGRYMLDARSTTPNEFFAGSGFLIGDRELRVSRACHRFFLSPIFWLEGMAQGIIDQH
jgi:hypothetical protein